MNAEDDKTFKTDNDINNRNVYIVANISANN